MKDAIRIRSCLHLEQNYPKQGYLHCMIHSKENLDSDVKPLTPRGVKLKIPEKTRNLHFSK